MRLYEVLTTTLIHYRQEADTAAEAIHCNTIAYVNKFVDNGDTTLTVIGMPVSAKATKMPIAIVRAFTKSTPTASPTENSSIASMNATAPVMITNDLISSVSGLLEVHAKAESPYHTNVYVTQCQDVSEKMQQLVFF